MDAVIALLRAAVRIADARAAIVAADGDPTPLAFHGCTLGAAVVALREGEGFAVSCEAPGVRASLRLVGATSAVTPALEALARELGVALLPVSPNVDAHLAGLAASVEASVDPVVVSRVAADGTVAVAYVNAAFERLFGFTPADLDGQADEKLFSAASLESVAAMRERLLAGDAVRSIVVAMRSRDGDALWIDLAGRTVKGDGGTTYVVSVLRDITARRAFETALASEKQRLLVTLKAIGDGVVTVLPDGRIDFVNAAAQRMLGIPVASEVYGKGLRSFVNLFDDRNERREIALDAHGDVRGEGRLDHGDRQVQIAFVSSPIISGSGETLGFVVVLRDVTAQARLTRRLAYEASHDALTRLPNRRHFEEMVGVAVESARDRSATHTVAFIDLDHFKSVNDTLGHQGGDHLLRQLAYRMSRIVRGNDVLARIGGDEFALLLHECDMENALRVAEKLRATVVTTAHEIAGADSKVSASIGLASLTSDARDAATVLAAADRACYAAKAGGRNAIVVAEVTEKG